MQDALSGTRDGLLRSSRTRGKWIKRTRTVTDSDTDTDTDTYADADTDADSDIIRKGLSPP